MLKVGLTGGYASGKSLVAAELERLGCHVIYADKLGHAVLAPDGAAYLAAVDLFGPDIVSPDASIDRKKLAAIVFASPHLLEKLTALVHPAVFALEERMLDDLAAQHPRGIAVIEAAILIEADRHTFFDRLILTACSVETQIARGMKRDLLTREQVIARLEKQMPLEQKKPFAHYVISTDGPKQATFSQVDAVFRDLEKLAEAQRV
ncbi:MAG TPA: dephospho-CoA kinase [Bryobacteraceae bacterium]|nr:dephospho-CoA kinase [Bryobacteraceae bacterium]